MQGKLKRTKPFYVPQFEALKALTAPEVCALALVPCPPPLSHMLTCCCSFANQEHKNLKITMAAPEWFHLRHGEFAYPKDVYKNDGACACGRLIRTLPPSGNIIS